MDNEIKSILDNHKLFLEKCTKGRCEPACKGKRASFDGMTLAHEDFSELDLRGASFEGATLEDCTFYHTDLSQCYFKNAKFLDCCLEGVTMYETNLSGATGLLDPVEWMGQFKTDDKGVLVYRQTRGMYAKPDGWEPRPGKVISEVPNLDRTTTCGCGVNFGSRDFIRTEYGWRDVWLCRIAWKDLPGVVVPYNTKGKARCSRLEYVEQLA